MLISDKYFYCDTFIFKCDKLYTKLLDMPNVTTLYILRPTLYISATTFILLIIFLGFLLHFF